MKILLDQDMNATVLLAAEPVTMDIAAEEEPAEEPAADTESVETGEMPADGELLDGETGTTEGEMLDGDAGTTEGEMLDGDAGTTDGEFVDGETGMEDGEFVDGGVMDGEMMDDGMGMDTGMMEGDMGMDMGMMDPSMMETGTEVKDPLLSNWFFVGGISVATLAVGIALGILWAKLKIKKGIDLYED